MNTDGSDTFLHAALTSRRSGGPRPSTAEGAAATVPPFSDAVCFRFLHFSRWHRSGAFDVFDVLDVSADNDRLPVVPARSRPLNIHTHTHSINMTSHTDTQMHRSMKKRKKQREGRQRDNTHTHTHTDTPAAGQTLGRHCRLRTLPVTQQCVETERQCLCVQSHQLRGK